MRAINHCYSPPCLLRDSTRYIYTVKNLSAQTRNWQCPAESVSSRRRDGTFTGTTSSGTICKVRIISSWQSGTECLHDKNCPALCRDPGWANQLPEKVEKRAGNHFIHKNWGITSPIYKQPLFMVLILKRLSVISCTLESYEIIDN